LDRTEVTNAQYRLCVNDGICMPPSQPGSHTREEYFNHSAYDNLPVIYVTWEQAAAYCEWVGGRLPTEAEWEYAARGASNRAFPWGDEFDGPRLNFCDVNCEASWAEESMNDSYVDTAPVGSYPDGASWCGVYDLAGNVAEWVADWYGGYSAEAVTDPQGVIEGEYRVYRNGSFLNYAAQLRATYRSGAYPDVPAHFVGFRCAMDAGGEQ
jgi:formylglycine-generating enzyme required for sulfatase activity